MFEPAFISHSGVLLPFKIELDSLTGADWDVIADLIGSRIDFQEVHGIPRGGLPLAARLQRFCQPQTKKKRRILIVDDVCTTGRSLNEYYTQLKSPDNKVTGCVVFARSRRHLPDWVSPIFLLFGDYADDF